MIPWHHMGRTQPAPTKPTGIDRRISVYPRLNKTPGWTWTVTHTTWAHIGHTTTQHQAWECAINVIRVHEPQPNTTVKATA